MSKDQKYIFIFTNLKKIFLILDSFKNQGYSNGNKDSRVGFLFGMTPPQPRQTRFRRTFRHRICLKILRLRFPKLSSDWYQEVQNVTKARVFFSEVNVYKSCPGGSGKIKTSEWKITIIKDINIYLRNIWNNFLSQKLKRRKQGHY